MNLCEISRHRRDWNILADNNERINSHWLNRMFNLQLNFSFAHVSTSILTITSLERFLYVYLPIKAREMCSAATAKRVMGTVVVFFTIFELQWFYIIDHAETTNKCMATSVSKEKLASVYKYFDAIFYSYLPIGSMVITNTLIIIKLVVEKRRKQNPQLAKSSLSKAAHSVTIMLLGTSLLFIVLTMPYAILYKLNSDMSTYDYAIIFIFVYSNHSFNVIVYTLTNSQFRKEMIKLCFCKKRVMVYPINVMHITKFNAQ